MKVDDYYKFTTNPYNMNKASNAKSKQNVNGKHEQIMLKKNGIHVNHIHSHKEQYI